MTVWLLVEDLGDEKEHVGLYRSPDAARAALSALVGDAPLEWLDGGADSVTLAFVRAPDHAGDRPARTFQLYPLEVERDEAYPRGEPRCDVESPSQGKCDSLLLDGVPSAR